MSGGEYSLDALEQTKQGLLELKASYIEQQKRDLSTVVVKHRRQMIELLEAQQRAITVICDTHNIAIADIDEKLTETEIKIRCLREYNTVLPSPIANHSHSHSHSHTHAHAHQHNASPPNHHNSNHNHHSTTIPKIKVYPKSPHFGAPPFAAATQPDHSTAQHTAPHKHETVASIVWRVLWRIYDSGSNGERCEWRDV